MIINGKYNNAIIYANDIDNNTKELIQALCDNKASINSKIRIMPDTHAGVGCVIGTTMKIIDRVVPNIVGVDIGCGMECILLDINKMNNNDFNFIDSIIRKYIPSGMNIREIPHEYSKLIDLKSLKCFNSIDYNRAINSIGTLGGGNHFIEIDKYNDEYYLVIHSGSRYLGKQVAKYYQSIAINNEKLKKDSKRVIIEELKKQGRQSEIEGILKEMKKNESLYEFNKDLAYLTDKDFEDYLHDIKIVQEFANLNRKAIADEILKKLSINKKQEFTTIHNYIDVNNMILRKGSISAQKGEKLIIPINMRDGSLICIGKGNEEWNFSAPHGAGRVMSRNKAKENISLNEFEDSMKGIWTTCINKNTVDESPMAYKSIDYIIKYIKETVNIQKIIKPVYNFKAN